VLAACLLAALNGARAQENVGAGRLNREETADRLRRDITFLASDECEGRGVTTVGINKAADYIVQEFRKAGLKPAPGQTGFFQPFEIPGQAKLGKPNTLVLRGPQGQSMELRLQDDFTVTGFSASGKVENAPLVFAGYAASADGLGYDDFKGIDVAGKVIVVLRKTPRPDNSHTPFDDRLSGYHAALSTKQANAEKHGAAAVLFVNDRDTARSTDVLMNFVFAAMGSNPSKIPALHVRRSVLDGMLVSSQGVGLVDVEADIDRQLKPHSTPLAGWTASLETHVTRPKTPVKNVIGTVEGSGSLANEIIVVGAHYDHLGYGGMGSLARGSNAIHHGADDNGSGTTSVLELARRFGQPFKGDRRRIVFMAFSAEESGLLGSEYYCKHPLMPLADTAAMVNLDMVGRLRKDKESAKDRVLVEGSGTAKTFGGLLDRLSEKFELVMKRQASGQGPSDHASFDSVKVPVLFYWTDVHSDYHRPTDTADKINIEGMAKMVDLAEDTIQYLATVAERPAYVVVPRAARGGRTGSGPRLGIMPAYGEEGKEGVLIEGVSEGGPAVKAGLKKGDRIVEIAGKAVPSIETYMALMAGQRQGDTIEVGIVRDGKKTAVKVKLE
jgi:hypothetical protein